MNWLKRYSESIVDLLYPSLCPGCGNDLLQRDMQLCIHCLSALPHTFFTLFPDNPVEKLFAGRLNVQAASSEFYFSKSELIQSLLHQLKYKDNRQIGHFLGTIIGESLLKNKRFAGLDVIVPVPLHPAKQFKRGYNQASIIGNGIAEALKIPLLEKCVVKVLRTETQTKKNRAGRWKNVSESFLIKYPQMLSDKSILLVDDVITTGATIEACGNAILAISGTKLSVVSVAYASK